MSTNIRINQEIKSKELRVVDDSGKQLGIMKLSEAQRLAQDKDLDLIEIAPNANPPVAKIMDWSKYQYQKLKEQQRNRRKSKVADLKQMRVGLKIGENDLNIKLNKVNKFLDNGDNVRITVVFKGREMAHKELGYKMIDRIKEILGDKIIIDQQPKMSGRNLSMSIRRK
ncbi:MAG: translation initiation factor IF-3 [Candidatus Nanosyncoccaceae bacterium]